MKKTKENILEIESEAEAIEFKKIGTGRRFFKVGQRVVDICEQEIDRYNYENAGFFTKLLKKSKYKKEKYLIESRIPSSIRAIAFNIIREDEAIELNTQELSKDVKEYILDAVNNYKEKGAKEKNKVIDIKTKKEA